MTVSSPAPQPASGRAWPGRWTARRAVVLAARRVDRLNELNAELGGGHVVIEADVAKQGDCERLIETAFSSLAESTRSVLNAGYGIYPKVHETTPDATRAIFATNVFGTTDCIYAATPPCCSRPSGMAGVGQVMIVSSAAPGDPCRISGFIERPRPPSFPSPRRCASSSPERFAVTSIIRHDAHRVRRSGRPAGRLNCHSTIEVGRRPSSTSSPK